MAVEIKHKFQSDVPDGPNTGFVRPSNWNDTHNISMEGERLLGKPTAGTGDAVEIGLGAGLQFSSTNITVTFGSTAGTAAEGNHTHPEATTSVPGFLSALDKAKLDGLATVASSGSYNDLTNKPGPGDLDLSGLTNNTVWTYSAGNFFQMTWSAGVLGNSLVRRNSGGRVVAADAILDNEAVTMGQLNTMLSGFATSAQLAGKFDTPAGTTSQYIRGDGSLATFPSIPAAQVNSDWNAGSGVAQILNKPTLGTAAAADTDDFATAAQGAKADTAVQPSDLATVATSGQYSDLAGTPTLADVATTGDYGDLDNTPTLGGAAALDVGTSAGTVAAGDDSRITGAIQTGSHAATSVIGRSANSTGNAADIAASTNDRILARVSNALSWVQLTIGMIPDGLITYAKIASSAIGTSAGTLAAGNDSRITGAVQKAGSGQTLTGSYLHTPYNYGNLGSSTITLNPANGLTGKITRTSGSGTIAAPSGTPTGFFNMLISIVGSSNTGSPSLSGFDHVDGDDLPGNNQTAALYVECCPDYKLALVKGVKGY